MYRSCSFLIGKRINVHFIGNHKCGIEAQSEMADDLIVVRFVLILFNKIGCAGEGDLVDVFLHLIRCHTNTIINKFQGFLFRIHDNLDFRLIAVR